MSNYLFGRSRDDLLGNDPTYFYGLRRTDDGDLYFFRANQLSRVDTVTINVGGAAEGNYSEFEQGVDFFEGRDVQHMLVYENLNYEQYRWDNKSLYYYMDEEGMLVVRINSKYDYPEGN